jgi:hypothetical protein
MTVAAMAMVAMKVLMSRSKRGGDTPPVLEAAEHALDGVAPFVDGGIAVELDLAVAPGRDDGGGAAFRQPGAQLVADIAPSTSSGQALSPTSSREGGTVAMQALATFMSWTLPG